MNAAEPVSIRPLGPKDVAEVVALEALCNPQPWGRESILDFSQSISEKELTKKKGSPVRLGCVGVRADGTLVGYALATALGDEAEIMVLGVHPEARRGGVGRAVLGDLLATLRTLGVASVFLEVRRGNKPAIALYRSRGFGEAGVRKGYYADTGEDALLLHVFLRG